MAKLKKRTAEDVAIDVVVTFVCLFTIVVMLYPFINVLAVSLNEPLDTVRGGITLWPRKFTLDTYRTALTDRTIYTAAMYSFLRTIIGTVASLFCTSFLGYLLCRKGFVLKKFISVLMLITMYFGAGLIPTYMLFKYLNLLNSFWVYVVPGLFYGFNVIIIRTYMQGLPDSLIESAMLDGAGEFKIFWKIMLPLAKPAIATVALFLAVGQWNSWFDTYLYAPKVPTLQYELMKKLDSVNSAMNNVKPGDYEDPKRLTATAVRAVYTVISVIPIIVAYPFAQRYFVSGMTIGSVKE